MDRQIQENPNCLCFGKGTLSIRVKMERSVEGRFGLASDEIEVGYAIKKVNGAGLPGKD